MSAIGGKADIAPAAHVRFLSEADIAIVSQNVRYWHLADIG
jgi:hypothetical protein